MTTCLSIPHPASRFLLACNLGLLMSMAKRSQKVGLRLDGSTERNKKTDENVIEIKKYEI